MMLVRSEKGNLANLHEMPGPSVAVEKSVSPIPIEPDKLSPLTEDIAARKVEMTGENDLRVTAFFPMSACRVREEGVFSVRVEQHGKSEVFVSPLGGPPSLCSGSAEIEQADYNFGGHMDFAIPHDHWGPYGTITHLVFLQNALSNRYSYSSDFSKITHSHLGMIRLDRSRKIVLASSKSGCCIHWTSEFTVVENKPRLIKTTTESLVPSDDDCEYDVLIERPGRPDETHRRSCTRDERE